MWWWALVVILAGCGLAAEWHSTLTVQGTQSVVVPLDTAQIERCTSDCAHGDNRTRGACLAKCPGALAEGGACTPEDHAVCVDWFEESTVERDGRCDETKPALASEHWRRPDQPRDAITCDDHKDMTAGGKVAAVLLLVALVFIGVALQ